MRLADLSADIDVGDIVRILGVSEGTVDDAAVERRGLSALCRPNRKEGGNGMYPEMSREYPPLAYKSASRAVNLPSLVKPTRQLTKNGCR